MLLLEFGAFANRGCLITFVFHSVGHCTKPWYFRIAFHGDQNAVGSCRRQEVPVLALKDVYSISMAKG